MMEKLNIIPVRQSKQTWNDLIPKEGCNEMCMLMVMRDRLQKNIPVKNFHAKLLKHGIIDDKSCYIKDYHEIFRVYGISEMIYHRTFQLDKTAIIEQIMAGNPVKARCTTNKKTGATHFMLIVGYEEINGQIFFNINDPMERDFYLSSETWEFADKDLNPTGRKLDRIEWFM